MLDETHSSLEYDLDRIATDYARHRDIHPGVVQELIRVGGIDHTTRLLDVGCGTGNYARTLTATTGCRVSGVEPSVRMREHARTATTWESLALGEAERLPFPDAAFDVVMSTDVIHHVGDRGAYFREAARVLVPGGRIATVTDSHEDIVRRRPLSSHFPETIGIELARYPAIPRLIAEMTGAGFTDTSASHVEREYELSDIQAYRDRAFSSLQLIAEADAQRGLTRLESDLARGPIPCLSLYTIVWGSLPRV